MSRPDHDAARILRDAEAACADLTSLLTGRLEAALTRVVDAHPGQPGSGSHDSGPVAGGGHGDPTGGAACQPSGADLSDLAHRTADARRTADALVRLTMRWEPHVATPLDRRTAVGNQRAEAGCLTCAKTDVAQGVQRWSPVAHEVLVADAQVPLCEWCYRRHRAHLEAGYEAGEALPTEAEVTAHHERARVPARPPKASTTGTGGAFTWRDPK